MKIKTSELIGAALDYAVAIAKGIPATDLKLPTYKGDRLFRYLRDEAGDLNGAYITGPELLFSSRWGAGGPVIQLEKITVGPWDTSPFGAHYGTADTVNSINPRVVGPTHLIAGMRCYCQRKLGDEVEVPKELL